jgi:hypothetical protein
MTTTQNGVFPDLLENTFFIRVPLLEKENLNEKKCFLEGLETHPDILRGGHRNQYQFKNVLKSGGTVFCLYHVG